MSNKNGATVYDTVAPHKEDLKQDKDTIILDAALQYIEAGLKVLPCIKKEPSPKIKSVNKVRQNPINQHNYSFYFDEINEIAILTGDHVEAIDVDSKYDLTGRLNENTLLAIRCTLPDVYEKLIIETSINKGLHLIYKCKQIGGNQTLAKRLANTAELAKGERVKPLIETRGQGGYLVCFPTKGYTQVQGNLEELDYITIEERQQLLAICRSFDLIGTVPLAGMTKRQNSLTDAPWTVYNRENDYTKMVEMLVEAGYEMVREDYDRVFVLRPNSIGKTSGSIWKASNILYLFSTSTEFEAEKPHSAFSVLCTLKFDGNIRDCAKYLADLGVGKWKADESEFYTTAESGRVEIKHSAIIDWLNDIGVRKYWYCSNDFEIIQVLDNIVQTITLDKIKKIFGDYIRTTVPEKVYNIFLNNIRSLFTKEGLLSQIEDLEIEKFIKSDAKSGYVFFRNGALKVSEFNNELFSYASLDGYVWKRNIIQRDFVYDNSGGDIQEFIWLISGNRKDVELMFICAFGYLLHNYKDPVNPKVIILNDEYYDENGTEPKGGSGKGLCIQILQHFRNLYSVDGKGFRLDKSFPFQGISLDTELFAIEDAAKGFDFERMFSVVTDGMTIEKKGKDEFKIPYQHSPKILITSNYAIKGSSSSHARRRYELEIASTFSHRYTPIDHFGHRFFVDWEEKDWSQFDNYMVNCLQTFLSKGLPAEVNINLKKKRLIQETNRDFINWIEDMHKTGLPDLPVPKEDFKQKFTDLFPDYGYNKLTTEKFTRWLVRWGKDNSVTVDASNRYNGVMVYRFGGQLTAVESHELSKKEKYVNEDVKYVKTGFTNEYLDSLGQNEDIF